MIENTERGERTNIEQNVMRRVHTIHILYAVFSGITATALLLLLSLWGIGREVWVAMVFQNGPHDFLGHLSYLFYAFVNTDVIVQLLTVVVLASVIYLARETAKLVSSVLSPVRI